MYNTLVLVFLAVAAVTCNDLQVGTSHGRKVFDEQIQASPAIWRQVQKITINNITDYEVISAVVVTDQRPEKDGVAKIVEGGAGQKNVTIELQSPTVFRGFDFHVVVYAVQDVDGRVEAQHPAVFSKDTEINASAKPEDKNAEDIKPTEAASGDEKPVEREGNPSVTTEQSRNTRNSENQQTVDPIVQYVNQEQEKISTQAVNGQEVTTLSTKAVNGQEVTTDSAHKVNMPVTVTTAEPNVEQELLKVVPQVKDFDFKIHGDQSTTVHAMTNADVTTVRDQAEQQNFDSISKELGQKVVFGIKKH